MSPRNQIRAFIVETFFIDAFDDAASFLQNGIIDSTGMLELVAFLEETFRVKVRDDQLVPENLDSLDRVTAFVERSMNRTAA